MKNNRWKSQHTVVPTVYVLLRDGERVLLLKRYNTGYRDGFYSLPAGHLNGGEPAINAAVRELQEEVGLKVRPGDLELVHTQHRLAEEKNHERLNLFFECTKWNGEPRNCEPNKCSEIRWADLNNLPDNLVPELRHFFDQFSEPKPYGHFGF